jgi:putative flippase GtrA
MSDGGRVNLVNAERTVLLGQIIRFGISGVALTVLALSLAWGFEKLVTPDPNLAFFYSFILSSMVGYVLHSRYSFRGHGSRDRPHIRTAQFFASNMLGFISNQFFVWLIRKYFGLPFWVEIIPVLFITPMITFTLNRKWVFG